MKNKKLTIVLVISVLALVLIWTPIKFENENSKIILGGYYWLMPPALKGLFLSISLVFSLIFLALPAIYYYLLKKIGAETYETNDEIAEKEDKGREVNEEKDILEDF